MNSPTVTEEPTVKHASLTQALGLNHSDALIVVDVQRDFLPGGALAIAQAGEIVPAINSYLAAFTARELPIFLTRDWHPEEHCSFEPNGGPWPPHCVQGTGGAEWAVELQVPDSVHVVSKAIDPNNDAYSAFEGTALLDLLLAKKIQRVFVAGVATDHCVRQTVLDAIRHGFGAVVLADAIRGINREPGDETRALREMMESGAVLFERSRGHYTHARPPGPTKRQVYYIGNFGFGVEVALPFEEAIERVIQALRNEGFGIISDIDVAAAIQSKLGIAMPPYRILGACNPGLAHRAIQAHPEVGLLLPCNVLVRRETSGHVFIEFMDPDVLGTLMTDAQMVPIAAQARRALRRAIGWI